MLTWNVSSYCCLTLHDRTLLCKTKGSIWLHVKWADTAVCLCTALQVSAIFLSVYPWWGRGGGDKWFEYSWGGPWFHRGCPRPHHPEHHLNTDERIPASGTKRRPLSLRQESTPGGHEMHCQDPVLPLPPQFFFYLDRGMYRHIMRSCGWKWDRK